MVTKNGICLNLKESEYFVTKFGLTFYFSSKMYLNKFIQNIDSFIETETIKFRNKYNVELQFNLCLAISYYKRIEKRGFFIYDNCTKEEIKDNQPFSIILI